MSTRKLLNADHIYTDDVLYGDRREATRLIEFAKANNNPDCIIRTSPDTFVDKQLQWNIKNLIRIDKRLKNLAETINVTHALPVQRFCWPQIHYSHFPFICITPRSSGKTFTHLFYIVTQCIKDTPINRTDEIISHSEQRGTWELNGHLNRQQSSSAGSSRDINLSNLTADDLNIDDIVEQSTSATTTTIDDQRQEDANREEDLRNLGYSDIESFPINPDNFIDHPKYIVICSSQYHVETIGRELDRMKLAAFGSLLSKERLNKLPPKVAVIHVHQTDEKLAIKFNGCEVLIATPGALKKCIKLDFVDFTKCRRVFFDDIDLSLQLHNANIRDIFKLYVVQMHDIDQQQQQQANECDNRSGYGYGYGGSNSSNQEALSTCKVHMFARKWTDLLKQSINTVFRQHVLIFGSIAEASVYANIRYEIEYVNSEDVAITKLRALIESYECSKRKPNDIMAITCRTNKEAKSILSKLDNTYQNKAVVLETDSILSIKLAGRTQKGPIYIISDSALEFIIGDLNCVTHLVHFSQPEEHIIYDQRFRLMYRHLISAESTAGICTTVFVRPKTSNEFVKELYDVLSRSSTTLRGTKLELRDIISERSNEICCRWASSGLCRLEKLSREDRFGSFCPNRHSFLPLELYPQDDRWPKSGQVKLTITRLVSPNEFYFWFEAYRDKDSPMKRWKKFDFTGSEFMQLLQNKLDKFKNTPPDSVPLKQFNQQQVYGVYFREEARVDRVVLLEKVSVDHIEMSSKALDNNNSSDDKEIPLQYLRRFKEEYKNQVEVLRIDYGRKVSVYLRNIFALPESLASIERQCYRAFHLGVMPTDNEPDWLDKAKKSFHELVCVDNLHEITAWMRMQSGRCFWFDNMVVSRELPEIGYKVSSLKTFPHVELINRELAVKCNTEPNRLPPSDRLETLCKWKIDDASRYASWAFLRKDKQVHDIYLLHAIGRDSLELRVRISDYNDQLINLEAYIHQDYNNNQLQELSYFAEGVLCVARLNLLRNSLTNEPVYEFNRCIIKEIISIQESDEQLDLDSVDARAKLEYYKYYVECLDHGDHHTLAKNDLFLAKQEYIQLLPFQTIDCSLADLNTDIFSDPNLLEKAIELFYDLTRDENNNMRNIKCTLKEQRNELYLYLPLSEKSITHISLIHQFEQQDIPICSNDDPELRGFKEFPAADNHDDGDTGDSMNVVNQNQIISENVMSMLIVSILDDIIIEQFSLMKPSIE